MGSIEAMKLSGNSDRYLSQQEKIKVAQGVAETVVTTYIPYLVQGFSHGLQDIVSVNLGN